MDEVVAAVDGTSVENRSWAGGGQEGGSLDGADGGNVQVNRLLLDKVVALELLLLLLAERVAVEGSTVVEAIVV